MSHIKYAAYRNRSGWNALLPSRDTAPPAVGRIKAKYAIVGAGYTGVAAARRLAELDPDAAIVLIEGSVVGEGASARNSGFTGGRVLPKANFGGARKDVGTAATFDKEQAVGVFNDEGFQYLQESVETYKIDCDLHRPGSFRASATEAGEQMLRGIADQARAAGQMPLEMTREDLIAQIGTSHYRYALYNGTTHLVQPAALIRGLVDTLPVNVVVYENTKVRSFKRSARWLLDTGDAEIEADTVILANNAFVKEFGLLKDKLLTLFTYAGISEELTAEEAGLLGNRSSWGLTAAQRAGGSTLRRVGDRRFMVRSLYSYEGELSPDLVEKELLARFHRRYPALSHRRFEFTWGGLTDMTRNGSPVWGPLDEGLWVSCGYNGLGIAKGTVLGKRLAEKIVGVGDHAGLEKAFGKANWIPPEPFRRVGFAAITMLATKQAGVDAT
ncbi:NAD(P)/FAD-dependent oxidoreductase [Paraburkholderia caledonica]|uniref:Glycine/D-amino acid oxidase-like deaminating enzyme n=1 Tax=Paraburkholderia caledonica TaxID=134536 RepID=A0AB73IMK3_9BURK|nr:glycine/D-amino acid oxidase-like deaminating enzyme [Paraburkholderia caledonica]